MLQQPVGPIISRDLSLSLSNCEKIPRKRVEASFFFSEEFLFDSDEKLFATIENVTVANLTFRQYRGDAPLRVKNLNFLPDKIPR